MKKTFKRALASLLVAIMLLTAAPMSGIADIDFCTFFEAEAGLMDQNGGCGENTYYMYNSDTDVLTIKGTGAIGDFSPDNLMFYNKLSLYADISIESIVIEDGVTSIGNYAFAFNECRSVKSVVIPDSVTSIGDYAFEKCRSLKSITLPDSITSIGSYSFYNCSSLYDIYFKDSYTKWKNISIGSSAISSKATIHYSLKSSGKCGDKAYWGFNETTGELKISGTGAIYDYAFYNLSEIKSVIIEDSISKIGKYTFYGCTGLTNIKISDGITSISGYAFYNCTNLSDIYYMDSYRRWREITNNSSVAPSNTLVHFYLKSSGQCGTNAFWNFNEISGELRIFGTGAIYDYSFVYLPEISKVVIEEGITKIGVGAFKECVGLKNASIPNSVTSIKSSAFIGCVSLQSIMIPNSVTSIEYYTFEGCTELSSVTIGKGITSIGFNAFFDCTNLKSITIPYSVTSIGNNAFNNCVNLSNLSYIGTYGEWKKVSLGSSAIPSKTVIHYNLRINGQCGDNAFWSFDEQTGELRITGSGTVYDYSFYCLPEIKAVIIDEEITNIGNYAFNNCANLTDIFYMDTRAKWDKVSKGSSAIPAKTIIHYHLKNSGKCGDNAFWDFDGQTGELRISGTGAIYDYSFYNLPEIKTVIIEEGITKFGNYSFSNCTNLTDIFYMDTWAKWDKVSKGSSAIPAKAVIHSHMKNSGQCGDNAFWNFDETTGELIISGTGSVYDYSFYKMSEISNVIIENGITGIGNNVFENCSGLTSVDIPDSVTSIGDSAFYDCSGLISMTIPASVTSIKNSTFYGCTGLTSISIPDSVISISSYAFYNCLGLTSLEIPDSVTSIGSYTFGNCSGLTGVEIPDKVKSIGDYAFYNCSELSGLTIPDSVTSIGKYAFNKCAKLSEIEYLGSESQWSKISKGSYAIPSGVKIIYKLKENGQCGENAFWSFDKETGKLVIIGTGDLSDNSVYPFRNRPEIKEIVIGDGITGINSEAFYNCTGLTSVTFPDSLLDIGSYAFYNCTELTRVTLPDSLLDIGSYAFYNCTGITSVTVPETIRSVGPNAFYHVNNVNYHGTVTDSPWGAITFNGYVENGFVYTDSSKKEISGCSSTYKGSLTIPKGVTSIDPYAFENCTGITSLVIPGNVTYIGNSAFYNCSGITELSIPCSTTIGNSPDTFGNCTNIEKIALTKGNGYMYDYDDYYSSYNTYYANTPWYISRDSIKEIVLENGIYHIGDFAFRDSYGVDKIVVPDSVTSIGDEAFSGCTGLESILIPAKTSSFGQRSFYNCTAETDIAIPNGTTSIGYEEFRGFKGLKTIVIPNSVKSLGQYSFSECDNLTDVYYLGTSEEWYNLSKANADIPYGVTVHYATVKSTTKSTCTENGYTTYLCDDGTEFESSFFNPIGHDDGVWKITKSPTLTSEGERALCCRKCGEVLRTEVIPKEEPHAREVKINDVELNYKDTAKLTTVAIVDDGVEYTVKYESSNPNVATVDKDGNITTLGKGEAKITCTVTDEFGNVVKDTKTVTVKFTFGQWLIWILLFGFLWY